MTDLLRAEQPRLRRENTVAERALPEDYLEQQAARLTAAEEGGP
jgi:hypothetical protein